MTTAQERLDLIKSTFAAMHAAGGFWSWGDADGIIPWVDREEHMVLAAWVSEAEASTECYEEESDEYAIFLTLGDLEARMGRLRNAGIDEVAVSPRSGRFLVTIPTEELRGVLKDGTASRFRSIP